MKGLAFRKLSRSSSHRNHLLRNLVTSLLEHERIVTTVAKAKEASRCAEKIITLGKRGTPTAMSSAQSFLFSHQHSLRRVEAMAKRYADRPGGYTRIHLMGHRKGDHAPRAILELVDNPTDVKLDMVARAMAREADIILRRAQKNIPFAELSALLAAQADIPLEHDERFAPLTRKNIAKLVRYRGEKAREQLRAKATHYLERLRAAEHVEGTYRQDTQRWDALELASPSRGRTLMRPMTGKRLLAGALSPETAAQVGQIARVQQPMRGKRGIVVRERTVTTPKPSVVRLAKGIYAKRYVRNSAAPARSCRSD